MKGDHVGEFEELVLLAVQGLTSQGGHSGRGGSEAYGVSVCTVLSEQTHRSVSLGAVYAALDRLEQKGLVRSEVTQGTAVRGGRSRRAFTLTSHGSEVLTGMEQVRARLRRAATYRPAKQRS